MPVASSIAIPKMLTDTPLGGFDIGVIAVIQDPQLNITEDRLNRIIIGAALGQRDPMQFQLTHQSPGLTGFTRVRRIPIQRDPDRLSRVALAQMRQKTTDLKRTLVLIEGPAAATGIHFVRHEQIKYAMGPLLTLQDQE